MWRRLLWLACLLLVLFSILLWRATSPTWVELGEVRTNWPLSEHWQLADYDIHWDVEQRQWRVMTSDGVVWESQPGKPWLGGARQLAPITLRQAQFGLARNQVQVCARQVWESVELVERRVLALGTFYCGDDALPVEFSISVDAQQRLVLAWATSDDLALTYLESQLLNEELLFGFGVQSVSPALQGQRTLGRSELLPELPAEAWVADGDHADFPILSNALRGWLVRGGSTRVLDLTQEKRWRLENWASSGEVRLAVANTPRQLASRLLPDSEPMELPDWFGRYPVLPIEGTVQTSQWLPLARHSTPLNLVVADPEAVTPETGQPALVGPLTALPSSFDAVAGWREYGLGSMVSAMLSYGLLGEPLRYSALGGSMPQEGQWRVEPRSKELYMRWLELNTFAPVLNLYDGLPAGGHFRLLADDESAHIHVARLAGVHEALWSYRRRILADAVEHQVPMVRPMWWEYSSDAETWRLPPNQYLLGQHLLVAPILQSATLERRVYLPAGSWTHLWSGREWFSTGQWITVVAPMGEPAVFVHEDFPGRAALLIRAHELGVSHLMSY